MENIIKLEKKLVPDLLDVLSIRYTLLRIIKYRQPIGRRSLSCISGISERAVRNEINFLKSQNLVDIKSSGMYMTDEGNEIYNGLRALMMDVSGVGKTENELTKALGIRDSVIVSVSDDMILTEIGKTAANYLRNIIRDDSVISLTGGRTVKAVIDSFESMPDFKGIKVVPARGGMGKETEIQSNTLVEAMANKLGASYELLHIPDNISESLFKALLDEGDIGTIYKTISQSDILIHGIGHAREMCYKRNMQDETREEILRRGAVGEAYGYFFNKEGKIVYKMPSVGFTEDGINHIPNMIAVAAGSEKAEAIIAIERGRKNSVLVTDEATALEILRILKS